MNGGICPFTIFVILSINMVMAFLLFICHHSIECINIRQMELNKMQRLNHADTFHSQCEANLGFLYGRPPYFQLLPTKTHSGQILSRD